MRPPASTVALPGVEYMVDGRLLSRVDRRRRIRDDDIHREADQLRGEVRQTALVILRRAVRNRQVLALEIPEVAQPLPEALEILDRSGTMRGAGAEKADAADLRRRRSGRGERRHKEAQGKGEEKSDGAARRGSLRVHGRVGALYTPRAREGNQILQHYTSKSVDTIRGYGKGITSRFARPRSVG